MSLLQLRSNINIAGIACLSGYLPLGYKPGVVSSTNKGTPVRMWHGTADPVVSLSLSLTLILYLWLSIG